MNVEKTLHPGIALLQALKYKESSALETGSDDRSLRVTAGTHLTTGAQFDLQDTPAHLLNALLLCVPGREGDDLRGEDVLQLPEGVKSALAGQHEADLE